MGRCSLAVALPVLSAMGVQCCPLPTSILSTHTSGFDPVVKLDQTGFVRDTLALYRQMGLTFDCIATGYFTSCGAIALAAAYLEEYPDTLRLVDPVMGDNGELYAGFDEDIVRAMAHLCEKADIITPNTTEAALLLGLPGDDHPLTEAALEERCRQLGARFGCDVLITGARLEDGRILCGGYEKKYDHWFKVPCSYVDVYYPGTGDLFAAVLAGGLLCGNALSGAAQLAVGFVQKAVAYTHKKGETEPRFGAQFEAVLPELGALVCR